MQASHSKSERKKNLVEKKREKKNLVGHFGRILMPYQFFFTIHKCPYLLRKCAYLVTSSGERRNRVVPAQDDSCNPTAPDRDEIQPPEQFFVG